MRFRWDWLSPVVTAPYVPALGPVAPSVLSAELFNAVVEVADTGRFLPYDKDRRWSSTKDERVITQEIIHRPGRTVIPTLAARGHGLLKIHCYGDGSSRSDEAIGWASTWCTAYGARAGGRVIWFQDTAEGARTRLMLKTFTDQDQREAGGAIELKDCEVADTFPAFAAQLGGDGFAFLHQRMKAGLDDGPVLVMIEDGRIVGAVGPLATMIDATGTRQQPPQYFAVHPDHRGKSHGRTLWRAAMAWGAANGARYKVLQASVGSAAEQLYLSEGLTTLGFLCSRDLAA
ncbi:MAG: GNAT family N-acetyltransferase [Egibacteraceae bacterium]